MHKIWIHVKKQHKEGMQISMKITIYLFEPTRKLKFVKDGFKFRKNKKTIIRVYRLE